MRIEMFWIVGLYRLTGIADTGIEDNVINENTQKL